jgi:putative membrane protein
MIAAVVTSAGFLISYIAYHATTGSVHFSGHGWIRTAYFSILISHTVLAALVPPLAGTALILALRGKFATHRKIARWAFPIWLYVSATGVLVYLMLYHWNP